MAGDPFRKVNPGDSVEFHSTVFNSLLDVVRAEKARKHSRTSESSPQPAQGTIIKVKNESGQDMLRSHIVGLNDPIFLASDNLEVFKNQVLFRGVIPSSSHKRRFAILLDPIISGGIGRAYIDGVAPVRINILDSSHVSCDITEGDPTQLVTVEGNSSCHLLWSEGTSGPQWGIVRFDSACCPEEEICEGSIEVTVRICSTNALVSGAVITIYDDEDEEIGTATTTATGVVEIDIPAAGTYKIKVVKTGQNDIYYDLDATCTKNSITLKFGWIVQIVVSGCLWETALSASRLPGATVTVTDGTHTYEGITNSVGNALISVQGTGTYSLTASHPRFISQTKSVSVTTCGTFSPAAPDNFLRMLPAPGYYCFDWRTNAGNFVFRCTFPLPTILQLTDAKYGGVTLTYNAAQDAWIGTKAVAFPGCTAPIGIICPDPTSVTVTYKLYRLRTTNLGPLEILHPADSVTGCPGGNGLATGGSRAQMIQVDCPEHGAFFVRFRMSIGNEPLTFVGPLYCRSGTHDFTLTE